MGIYSSECFLREADIINKSGFVFRMRYVIWNEIAMFSRTMCEAEYQAISREIYEKISGNTERQGGSYILLDVKLDIKCLRLKKNVKGTSFKII